MNICVSGLALIASLALAAPAMASAGQCRMTGYDDFACDIDVDGGGMTFALPDGQSFVFAHTANNEGLGYLIEGEAGGLPEELGMFAPVDGEPGCWFGEMDEITFCAAIEQ